MLIHLEKDDVILICEQAVESFDAEDDGEAFTEEVVKRLEDADIEAIESRSGGSADEFFMEVFAQWDGADATDILDLMVDGLNNIDIELTYDEVDLDEEADEDDDDYDYDDEDDLDDDEDEEFDEDDNFAD